MFSYNHKTKSLLDIMIVKGFIYRRFGIEEEDTEKKR